MSAATRVVRPTAAPLPVLAEQPRVLDTAGEASRATARDTVTIIIPAYNEAETVGRLVEALACVSRLRPYRVLLIDDGSGDGTGEIALAAGAEVIVHPRRRGNGRTIKTGLAATTGGTVVILDGDGQHDPAMVPLLLAALDEGADLAVARRTVFRGSGLLRDLGNHVLSALASYMTRSAVPDLTSGFRAFRAETMQPFVHLLPEGFSTPTTSTLAYLHSGLRVQFIPMPPRRRGGSGSTHTRLLRDGPGFLAIAVKVTRLFRPMRALGPLLAGAALAIGITTFAPVPRWWALPALFVAPVLMILDGVWRLRRGERKSSDPTP
jgi:glycosyltransferase involved in cell wall biosynthesis